MACRARGAFAADRRNAVTADPDPVMLGLFLEAMGALAALLFIVWWTMFSGRKGGERKRGSEPPPKR
jgi:hypothetical protein